MMDRVEAGEHLVVLRGGRPVAELRPVPATLPRPRPFGLCAGAFAVPDDFDSPLPEGILGIASLPIDEGAMSHLAGLPPLHRDPFDRLLVAQALQHGLTAATVDSAVAAYSISLLPAG